MGADKKAQGLPGMQSKTPMRPAHPASSGPPE
jgi:hypothetical protein